MEYLPMLDLAKQRQAEIKQDMDKARRWPGSRGSRKASAIWKSLLTQIAHAL